MGEHLGALLWPGAWMGRTVPISQVQTALFLLVFVYLPLQRQAGVRIGEGWRAGCLILMRLPSTSRHRRGRAFHGCRHVPCRSRLKNLRSEPGQPCTAPWEAAGKSWGGKGTCRGTIPTSAGQRCRLPQVVIAEAWGINRSRAEASMCKTGHPRLAPSVCTIPGPR